MFIGLIEEGESHSLDGMFQLVEPGSLQRVDGDGAGGGCLLYTSDAADDP